MKIDPRCIPCNMSALVRILSQNGVKREEQLVAAGLFLKDMAEMDLEAETPIEIGRNVGKALKAVMGEIDAFREVKKAADDLLIEVYNELKEKLRALEDPLIGALKLSVAGNIIDFAPGHRIDIDSTMRQALAAPFAIDDLEELSERIKGAKSMLIVGDNCGEVVLDKLLMEIAGVPETYFAVRSKPALNDVTMKEALEVGLDSVATLIDSGADAPGMQEDRMSDEFEDIYTGADVVISKGQGNLEGLSSAKREIFFLLMAKCEVIGSFLNVPKGSFVAYRKA
ncbi:MAG TPA: ARMT1-like domain-containing protein [Mesotoga sp.]|nr:DUF89 family protein [Mesotoga sp.]MDI9376364.1 ARMT1-like domain-containing protein [Thermotogota bacterium]NLX33039.1 DUF89 family protein [Thermotogaceae bacterium]MDD4039860.1 ARMT1-like domain-containing protein [Mesotoga sp.]MDD5743524.1 ARMT1-like domain-containing protein [Mesotoga sp.]